MLNRTYAIGVAVVVSLLGRTLSSADCNLNGVEDEVDLERGTAHDCDLNSNPDECDLALRSFKLGPPTAFPVAVDPRRAAPADLDSDGDMDLAVTSGDGMQVTPLLNEGAGAFTKGQPVVVPGQPHFVLAAQLDDDDRVDLVVASTILWNDGSARFPDRLALANGGFEVVAADLDADGDLDLASVTNDSGYVYLFTNQGGRVFDTRPNFFVSNDLTGSIRVADLDDDGRNDLVLGGGNGVVLAAQQENGDFSVPPRYWLYTGGAGTLDVADVGGDGDLDVVTAGATVAVLENQGSGELLVVQIEEIPPNAYAITLADLNGDDLPEILLPSSDFREGEGGFAVLLNEGNQRYASAKRYALGLPGISVVATDFNGDGGRDVAFVHRNPDAVSVLMVSASPEAADCDRNGLLDDCQADCDQDGLADACALLSGQSRDDDLNGVPDECDPDCDGDGAPDVLEIAAGAPDCDRGGVPDVCDLKPVLRLSVPPELEAEGRSLGVTTGDLDGDGDLDLITVNLDDKSLSVFDNDGERRFALSRRLPAGEWVSRVEAVDVDGDADLDLVAGSESTERVILFPNRGLGSLLAARTVLSGDANASWDLADFDRDGDLDLVVSRFGKQDIVELTNSGSLKFEPPRVLTTYFGFTGTLLVADLDSDRLDDFLVVPMGGQARLHLNKGDGTFSPFMQLNFVNDSVLTPADVDSDGDLDLLFPSRASIGTVPNLGSGRFGQIRSKAIPGGDSPLLAADMNADGVVDIVTHGFDGSVVVIANDGGKNLAAGPSYASASGRPASGDIDGDGNVDLAVPGAFSPFVQVLWNEGNRRLAAPRIYDSSGASALVAGDLDSDGDLDLVGAFPGGIAVLINQGDGSLASPKTYPALGGRKVTVFDSDGDHDLDIALPNNSQIDLLKNAGDGTFNDVSFLDVGQSLLALEARDMDGDGIADLSMLSQAGFLVARGDGKGQFRVVSDPDPGLVGSSMTLADFDDDGDQDVAVMTYSVGLDRPVVVVANNRGDSHFGPYRQYLVPDSPVAIVAADFNQDGGRDLAVAGSFDVVVLRNDGSGSFVPFDRLHGDNLRSLDAGDIDGDGFTDLILGPPLAVAHNLGGKKFAPPVDLGFSFRGDLAGLADLNGDRGLDLVLHHSDQTVLVVFNASGPTSKDENRNGVPDNCELNAELFHRGDANADGRLDVSDGLCLLQFLFEGSDTPPCLEAADANNDARLDCSDSLAVLGFLFLGSQAPPSPGPPPAPCGPDTDVPGSAADLGCTRYSNCPG